LVFVFVTKVELGLLEASNFSLKTFFLIGKRLEGTNDLFHLAFLIMDEQLEVFVFLLELFAVLLEVGLCLDTVLDLAIFQFD